MGDRNERMPSFILSNSPVPFVIIGARGIHRQVFVKSSDAPLDLTAQDYFEDFNSDYRRPEDRPNNIFNILAGNFQHRSYIVKSEQILSKDLRATSDDRRSFMSFAWRGLTRLEDVGEIQYFFDRSAVDIQIALENGSGADLEWILAPLLARCRTVQDKYFASLQRKRMLYITVFCIYSIFALLLITKGFDKIRI